MERKYDDVKVLKSGSNYLVLQIPKKSFDTLPDGYFFCDVELKKIRGGQKK